MSALGANMDAPSEYLRSKAEAEVVINSHGLKTTIFRPSVIFGEGDNFINQFKTMLKLTPVMGAVCPQAQLSPVWVEDVARAMVEALHNKQTIGQVYELCGGRTYTMLELIKSVAESAQTHTKVFALSDRMSKFMAKILGALPGNLFTMDNYHSLQVASICDRERHPINWQPRSLRNYLAQEITPTKIRARYMKMRKQAGRYATDRS
jgi:NADH dehydrogenase